MSKIPLWFYDNDRDIVGYPFFLDKENIPNYVSSGEISSNALKWNKGGTYEEYFLDNNKFIYVFVIDARNSASWILDNHMFSSCYLVRYDLEIDDLESLDWIIPFPPDERMKCINMNPPYEEVIGKYGN